MSDTSRHTVSPDTLPPQPEGAVEVAGVHIIPGAEEQVHDFPATDAENASRAPFYRRYARNRVVRGAVAALGLATLGMGAKVAIEDHVPQEIAGAVNTIGDIGWTPRPPVSAAGTKALINLNDGLRVLGPVAVVTELALWGSMEAKRARDDRFVAMMEAATIHTSSWRETWIGKALPVFIVSAVATASGLGAGASKGANKPVRMVEAAVGATPKDKVIVEHPHTVPFDHSIVTPNKLARIEQSIQTKGVMVTPYIFALGDLRIPGRDNQAPSSAPLVLLPEATIETAFGVRLQSPNADPNQPCNNLSIIVGKQLGAPVGSKVLVEGAKATVAETVEALPGLDRVVGILSLEEARKSGCIFEDEPFSGAIATGLIHPEQLQKQLDALGITYTAEDIATYERAYTDFWIHSIDPAEMELVLLLLGASVAAIAYIGETGVLMRQKNIAALIAQGVSPRTLSRAEAIKATQDNCKAVALSVPLVAAAMTLTNSSQYGIELPADVRSLGAGALALGIVTTVANRRARRIIRNTDAARMARE